ncbi:bifunctional ATP synthase [Babesia duncani]|uniref:Bifunctional ATP synthase n=1 Tax=Babesia duncani TaxID=323732 RepID=A0AAD9PHT8_9APIC|nr:bifunctional ATP synthase [Babesia duncani]KAK2197898.1 bifunctional ATP synthase [Babesia duncani]
MSLFLGRSLRCAATAAGGSSLRFSLLSPHESFFVDTPVKQVTVPGSEGYFTLTGGHSPMLATLKPGVVSFISDSGEDKYFISSGFLVFKRQDDNYLAQVTGVEIVPLSHLDKERTVAVLQQVLAESQGSTDSWTKTRALLAQDLCSAILKAI